MCSFIPDNGYCSMSHSHLTTTSINRCLIPISPLHHSPSIQVLAGIYPIPQAKEPVASVAYLAECIPIEDILELPVPQDTSSTSTLTKSNNNNNNKSVTSHGYTRDTYPWSGLSICEAYAKKRGFNLPHGRVDSNRAAQHILYAVADGTIPFYFEPPDLN